jgi:xanthosine utilization system XapX-like protein
MEHLLSILQTAYDGLNWFALNVIAQVPWDAVAASGILSGLLLFPQKLIKKLVDDTQKVPFIKLNREQFMICLVGLAGLAVSAVHYLLSVPTNNPSLVALQGLALSFGTQPFYFLAWKPFVKWFNAKVAQTIAANDIVTTAKVPEGGLGVAE